MAGAEWARTLEDERLLDPRRLLLELFGAPLSDGGSAGRLGEGERRDLPRVYDGRGRGASPSICERDSR